MEEKRQWILVTRKLANEATEQEFIELDYLLNENPNLHQSIEALEAMWNIHNGNTNEEIINERVQAIIQKSKTNGTAKHEAFIK